MANAGKEFEKQFKDSMPIDVYYLRLVDSAVGFDVANSTQRFAAKNPYDVVLYKYPTMYALELKSTIGTSFSFKGKSPMIKEHQLKSLRKAAVHCKAGFIFNFRKTNNTYYVPIETFDTITSFGMLDKSSVNEFDIANAKGTLRMEQKLKKVNFTYDIGILFR